MSFNPEEYAGQLTIADEPVRERCNEPHCNHAEDEDIRICDSCHGKTCYAHATRYSLFVLCRACGAKELVAKTEARRLLMALDMFHMEAGSIADRLREIAEIVENWDVDATAE